MDKQLSIIVSAYVGRCPHYAFNCTARGKRGRLDLARVMRMIVAGGSLKKEEEKGRHGDWL